MTVFELKIGRTVSEHELGDAVACACVIVDNALLALERLEREAFDESGFNEDANTAADDAAELKAALENIADEVVDTTRMTVAGLIEVRLTLSNALNHLREAGGGK